MPGILQISGTYLKNSGGWSKFPGRLKLRPSSAQTAFVRVVTPRLFICLKVSSLGNYRVFRMSKWIMSVNFNLQGAKITYEREANLVIDYSSLSRNLKQVRSRHFVCLLRLFVKLLTSYLWIEFTLISLMTLLKFATWWMNWLTRWISCRPLCRGFRLQIWKRLKSKNWISC